MRDIDYPIIGYSYPERSEELDIQRTVNWYLVEDPTAVKKLSFAPTPGTAQILQNLDNSDSPVRQIYSYKNFGLVFVAENVYSYDQNFNVNYVGSINSNAGYISVCNGSSQIMIVDGEGGYVYDLATGNFGPITNPDFLPNPLYCTYFNDFFIACDTDTNVWQVSAANNATDWTILGAPNNATISAKADTFVGMGVVNQRLYLFGNYITETWYAGVNPAYPQFPYSRDNNAIFEYGCAATATISNGDKHDDGILCWLSATRNGVGSVMMTDGGKPIRITPPAVDWAIQQYKVYKDAIGFCYNQDGHIFYQLTFPTENVTWLGDITVKDPQGYASWVNLEIIGGNRHMATCHTYFLPKVMHLVGSNAGPKVLRLSSQIYTNSTFEGTSIDPVVTTQDIQRTRVGSNFYLEQYNRFNILKFECDFEGGVGQVNNPGEDPQVYLSVSYDYGHTFSDPCKAALGKTGQYKARAYWFGRGITRSFIPRLDVYFNGRVYLIGGTLKIEESIN